MQYNGIKIHKRADGRWEAKKQINGNRISICRNTQSEVYEELKAMFPKKSVEKTQKHTLLHDYIDYWFKTYKEPFLKKQRKNTYNCVIKNQIKPYFTNKDINLFTINEINRSILNIPNTRQKEEATQFLRNIFKHAYKDKKIKEDISEDIVCYQHKREEGQALTQKQRKIFIKQAQKLENGKIFLFYLYTGARASELLNINPATDITKDMIHLPGTKTDLSDRWIPILKPLQSILATMDLTKSKLFQTSYRTLERQITELRQLCGWHVKIKDLRTTYGTILAEMGVPIEIISKWMGHTTTKTTKKYYIKILSDYEKQQVEKLNKQLDDTFDDTFSNEIILKDSLNQYLVPNQNIKHKMLCYVDIEK